MPLPQQKFREIAFQLLYSYDTGFASQEDMTALLMSELKVTRKPVEQAQIKVTQLRANLKEIDALIASHAQAYEFERIQSVERNILRLALFEMMYEKLEPKIAISEGLRLEKKFGSPEGIAFVNAVLDSINKDLNKSIKPENR